MVQQLERELERIRFRRAFANRVAAIQWNMAMREVEGKPFRIAIPKPYMRVVHR